MHENKPETQETGKTKTPSESPYKTASSKEKVSFKDFFSFVFMVAIIVVPIRMFVAQPFVVSGDSMLPNFHTGEYLIVDQLTYHFSDPERGDVIVFKYPNDQDRFFIKRIIGLPGETIKIEGEEVTIINKDHPEGFTLLETQVTLQKDSEIEKTLPENEYFVMGDNRLESLDSRVWGNLPRDLIVGRAFLRLLPLTDIDYLPSKINY